MGNTRVTSERQEGARLMADIQPRIGPWSRTLQRGAIGASIDGRSREGRYLRNFEAMLAQHVGGKPSATQRVLIARAAKLALRLELFDERTMAVELGERSAREYLALSNHLRLCMRELGLKGAEPRAPSLAGAFAEASRAGDADAA